MLIGWAKITMAVELDMRNSKNSYTEMRTGWFRALQAQGHTIKVLTTLSKSNEEQWSILKEKDLKTLENIYDRILASIRYDPTGDASDCQLLIIENGPVNWMYGCNHTGQPQIRRIADILNSYKGLVLIEQSDADLMFPFYKLADAPKQWSAKGNPYRLKKEAGHPDLENWGWGDHDEIFKDKKYVVIVKSPFIDEVAEEMNGTRFKYVEYRKQGLVDIRYIGQAYDFKHLVGIEKFQENPQIDLLYTGYPRNREERFTELMLGNPSWMNMSVTGPWHKKKNQELADQLLYGYICSIGYLRNWLDLLKIINGSKMCLYLAVKKGMKLGWETSRPLEALMCGSILVCDSEIRRAGELFGPEFCIDGKNKVELYKRIMTATVDERRTMWSSQIRSHLHKDWHWFLKELNEITLKYGIKVLDPQLTEGYSESSPLYNEVIGIGAGVAILPPVREVEFSEMNQNSVEFHAKIREKYARPRCYTTCEEKDTSEFEQYCKECAWRFQYCLQLTEHVKKLEKITEEIFEPEQKSTIIPNVEVPEVLVKKVGEQKIIEKREPEVKVETQDKGITINIHISPEWIK